MLLLLGVIYANQRELYRAGEADSNDFVSMLGENIACVNSMAINNFSGKNTKSKIIGISCFRTLCVR